MLGQIHDTGPEPVLERQSERAFLSAGRAAAPDSQSDRASLRTAIDTQVMCRIGRFK